LPLEQAIALAYREKLVDRLDDAAHLRVVH